MLPTFSSQDKAIRITLFLLFAILLAGSVIYVQERMLFCDASFILTRIINTGHLQIQEHRYGSIVTQMVPLLASKAHLPLASVVLLYSLSFNIFYLTIVCLLLFHFRNISLAILMSFYFVLFVSDTYFWTNNEIHQAIAWMFLFFAIVLHRKKRASNIWLHSIWFTILAFLALFTHPIVVIVLPFLWVFLYLDKELRPYSGKTFIAFSFIILILCVVKYYLMSYGSYDSHKIRSATHFSIQDILQSFTTPMMQQMGLHFFTNYFFVPILFIAGIGTAIKQQKRVQLWFVAGFALMYIVMIGLTIQTYMPVYTESEWMPFTIIACALFVFYSIPKMDKRYVLILLLIVFCVRIGYIIHASQTFTQRKIWIYSMIQKMKLEQNTKALIHLNKTEQQKLLFVWSLPAESMVASALQHDKPNYTFAVDTLEGIANEVHSTKEIILPFEIKNYTVLNPLYFSADTITLYKNMVPVPMQ